MSLRARLLLGYVVMLSLFGIVLAAALMEMRATQSSLAGLSAGYLPLGQEIGRAGAGPLGLELQPDQSPERLFRVRNPESIVIARMGAQLRRARELAVAVAEAELSPGDGGAMAGVIGDIDGALRDLASYTETHRQFVELFEAGDSSPGRLVGQLIAHQRRIDVRLQELTRLLARRSSEVVNRTEKAQRDALFAVVGLSGVAFGLGLLLLFSINFTLRPIGRLTAAAERIREGQLDARAPEESSDEVGRLARTFNEMAAALEERERRLEERSRELEAALADLQASQEALIRSERLATIGRMAAQIAHEVRNPLNALGLNADMLAEELSEPGSSDAARTLAAIRAEIDRLTEITEDYLALGRLPPLRLERQPLSNLVEELVRFQGQELDGVGVEVELDLDAADSEVLVDAGQMRQALLNLVRNAAEALAENGGGHLRIGSESRGGEVVLLIADDGPGMGEAHVAQVFDPFFSTKERGSGLGLPLTHHVISEHGGRIDCKSQVGEGTTFRIFLPEAEAAAGLDNPSTEGAA